MPDKREPKQLSFVLLADGLLQSHRPISKKE